MVLMEAVSKSSSRALWPPRMATQRLEEDYLFTSSSLNEMAGHLRTISLSAHAAIRIDLLIDF